VSGSRIPPLHRARKASIGSIPAQVKGRAVWTAFLSGRTIYVPEAQVAFKAEARI